MTGDGEGSYAQLLKKAKAGEAAKVCSRCHKPYHGDPYLEHGDGRVGV